MEWVGGGKRWRIGVGVSRGWRGKRRGGGSRDWRGLGGGGKKGNENKEEERKQWLRQRIVRAKMLLGEERDRERKRRKGRKELHKQRD